MRGADEERESQRERERERERKERERKREREREIEREISDTPGRKKKTRVIRETRRNKGEKELI